ncbi:hypothetical protein [Ferrimonas sp. YFM]|uniref:hypothetical protein n=1 Tax=Ferrimonas sp. YFM TaxID=3028878 RepID=UPI002572D6CF|nr:hypothetical protein [Ferrimonas sp. YFM]
MKLKGNQAMDNEISPSFKIASRIWWNITWKTILFAIPFSLIGGMLGAMIGLIATGGNDPLANQIGSIMSYLAAIPVAILVISSSLNESYGKYRVSLTVVDPLKEEATHNESTT